MMKRIALLFVLFCASINILSAQNKRNAVITGEYYSVSDSGKIDYNSIIRTKTFKCRKSGILLSCASNNHGHVATPVIEVVGRKIYNKK